jgi:hypothetical protein
MWPTHLGNLFFEVGELGTEQLTKIKKYYYAFVKTNFSDSAA